MTTGGGPLGFEPDEEPRPPSASRTPGGSADPAGLQRGSGRSRVPLAIALLAAVALLVTVTVNTIRTSGVPSAGLAAGAEAPPFAAPLALSARTGDVNVAREAGQGAAGSVPACSVRGAGIVNACDLWADRPVVLGFFSERTQRCVDLLAQLERLRRREPGLQVAAVALGGDRDRIRGLVRDQQLGYPVAYDHDSVLANLYGVAVCPLVTFVRAGGIVDGSLAGTQPQHALDARAATLARGTPPAA